MLVRGRRPHWTFRGLLNVHSRYGLSARCIAKATHLSRRLRRFRYLPRRPDSYRLERPSCRVGIAPTEDPTPSSWRPPVVSPTDQRFGATGDEGVVMHAGAVEGQPAFATEGVIDRPVSVAPGKKIVTTSFARHMEKVSMSQAAWLKKR